MTQDQYCDTLTLIAMRLVAAVRDEGPQDVAEAIAAAMALPAPPGINPTVAFAVTLAAAIPADRTRTQLWGWTLGIPGAAALPTGHAAKRFAVEMALRGHLPLSALSADEQTRVVRILAQRKWPSAMIAARLDADITTVAHIRRNPRKAAEAA